MRAVSKMLAAVRELNAVAGGLEKLGFAAEPLQQVMGTIEEAVWEACEIRLAPEWADEFYQIIFSYEDGKIEIDTCLQLLEQFAAKQPEEARA